MIFAIFFATMNRHTYKLFKNIFDYVQTECKGEIKTAQHNYSKLYLMLYQLKSLNIIANAQQLLNMGDLFGTSTN